MGNKAPFSRALAVILAIAAIFLGGCRSQSPGFYTLSPIQEDQVTSKRKSPAQNAVIGIGPVKLADYLDQSMLVTRTSDNQAVKAEFDRWVGSFKDNFINVLTDNIGFLLPTERIYLYPCVCPCPSTTRWYWISCVAMAGWATPSGWRCAGESPGWSCSKLIGPVFASR